MAGFVSEERLVFGPWSALERALARLLRHAGFGDVSHVGGSGDQGADVVGTHGGKRWVIQSKYRGSGGVDAAGAREAVRAMNIYDAPVGVVAANTYFTEDAYALRQSILKDGIDLRLWDGDYLLRYFRQLPTYSLNRKRLRDYQVEAVDTVEQRRGEGRSAAAVVMATGLGKSLIAAALVENELERNPNQEVLVLAHMNHLVSQLEASFWSQLKKQHSTHLWAGGETPSYHGGVVFATWQSMHAAVQRGEQLSGRYGLVIVDEAHHAPSDSYRALLEALQPNFLVGLTATPWRGDERRMEEIFGEAAFTMDIVDGMQRGYLAEVDYRMLTDGIDWEAVARKSREGLTVKDLNKLLLVPERDIAMVDVIAAKMEELSPPRALGFCRSIAHAERLRPLLSAKGIRVAVLHSGLSQEQQFRNLSGFRVGELDMLLSVEMLNEGLDIPDVNLVAFMRVTHSRRIFVQQLGRGLRLSDGKSKVLVLDFVADIRRLAAGTDINRRAAQRAAEREVFRFKDGRIVQFGNDYPRGFFDEYVQDVADIENLDDGAQLRFPDGL